MNITFIPNRSVVLVTKDGRRLTANADSPNWAKVEKAIKARDEKALEEAISLKAIVQAFGQNVPGRGDISVVSNRVFYRGTQLHGMDVDRLISYVSGGFPEASMIGFLESKLRNQFPNSVEALYMFLENKGMPLTDNGSVLGYKGVREDYFSINTGNEPLIQGFRDSRGGICNRIGQTVWLERKYVCDDNNQPCGPGLHIGSENYARGWAGQGGRVMIAEFWPEFVVSVPKMEHEKLRVYKYRIVGEVTQGGYLGNVYNGDYVRPDAAPDPDEVERIEVQSPTYEGAEQVAQTIKKAEDLVTLKAQEKALKAKTEYAKAFALGFADGRGHQKRRFYEQDRGRKFQRWTKEYVEGYLGGYRDGRTGIGTPVRAMTILPK